jgi:hypothetical protein
MRKIFRTFPDPLAARYLPSGEKATEYTIFGEFLKVLVRRLSWPGRSGGLHTQSPKKQKRKIVGFILNPAPMIG